MTQKAVLILGEEDGDFRYHPPLCEDSPPEWFICLTEDQQDELRGVLREWKQRGIPVVLRLAWAPGDFNIAAPYCRLEQVSLIGCYSRPPMNGSLRRRLNSHSPLKIIWDG
jgi:hypothetical protein